MVMAAAFSFGTAWVGLKSGIVLTATFICAAHSVITHTVCSPLTGETGPTEYVIDAFAVALALAYVVAAVTCWQR